MSLLQPPTPAPLFGRSVHVDFDNRRTSRRSRDFFSPALKFDNDCFVRGAHEACQVCVPVHVKSCEAVVAPYAFVSSEPLQPRCLNIIPDSEQRFLVSVGFLQRDNSSCRMNHAKNSHRPRSARMKQRYCSARCVKNVFISEFLLAWYRLDMKRDPRIDLGAQGDFKRFFGSDNLSVPKNDRCAQLGVEMTR